ncbi:MAG: DUF1836 domain-containing protein [Negativicutes bacterium]|nr:DUF1836 domain-containing protein [Negativicutes bacterium]
MIPVILKVAVAAAEATAGTIVRSSSIGSGALSGAVGSTVGFAVGSFCNPLLQKNAILTTEACEKTNDAKSLAHGTSREQEDSCSGTTEANSSTQAVLAQTKRLIEPQSPPDVSDIPCLDLYIDQLLIYLNSKIGHLERTNGSTPFSRTMINNYVRDGIIKPPVNKKYNKEHVLSLILISYLKNILSMSDIAILLKPIAETSEVESLSSQLSFEDIYRVFVKSKIAFEKTFQTYFQELNFVDIKINEIKNDELRNNTEDFLSVLMLVALANMSRRIAINIINTESRLEPKS